jgi:ribonuclease D
LPRLRQRVEDRLDELGRRAWLEEEMAAWQQQVLAGGGADRWRRMSGISGLDAKGLAVLRELWHWRDERAARLDQPPRRVLRDDLLIEIARCQPVEPGRIGMVRGMERRELRPLWSEMAQSVQRALALDPSQYPRSEQREIPPQLNPVAQLLTSVLGGVCRRADVAVGLVGTVQDVRDLIAYRLGLARRDAVPPALACGWRAQVVGTVLEDILAGRVAIRVSDPLGDNPLTLEERG